MPQNSPLPNPTAIMQLGMGFWGSKTLLTAISLGLFTRLAERPMKARELKNAFGFQCDDRHVFDFLDSLVSFGFLLREGILDEAVYSNNKDADFFLDRNKPSYLGGILEMANHRLYGLWGGLEDSLRTGRSQNKGNLFEKLYESPEQLREFLNAMRGIQMGNFMALAHKFDFSRYQTLCDAGGASADLCIQVAKQHEHIRCVSYDLPPVEPIALENIRRFGLENRISTRSGDFFKDPLPAADVVVMANVLHDWSENHKRALIRAAYDALPAGGACIVVENVIDDERSHNTFGLLMSLNMLIEVGDEGFDYTFSDFRGWAREAGFSRTETMALAGPASAIVSYK